ncbi:hypothetical protein [Gluconobacter sp. P5B12]|uniref:hypothetical protein n=1 Tax=unclassified Gluconobacter TaxID=2644261 RepID=UPI001C05896B|nr:hypothetical protein [Gluconobacter sp. P5B12]
MKYRVVFEVDNSALFDMISKSGFEFIGGRLAETLLCPNDVPASTAIGMAVYGVTVSEVEPIAGDPA